MKAKNIFKLIGYGLSVPFVLIAIGWSVLRIKSKAKRYLKEPQTVLLPERLKAVYKLFKKVLYFKRLEVVDEGFDQLPIKQMIYMPNHKSNWDPIALFVVLYEKGLLGAVSFISKIENSKNPALDAVLKLIDGIYIKRDDGRSILACYNKEMENIKKGHSIIVFPEGTRVPGHTFKRFQPATLKVAYQNFLTIAPIAIYGADLKRNKTEIYKHKIYLSALKAIQPINYMNTLQDNLMVAIQERIMKKYFQLKLKYQTPDEIEKEEYAKSEAAKLEKQKLEQETVSQPTSAQVKPTTSTVSAPAVNPTFSTKSNAPAVPTKPVVSAPTPPIEQPKLSAPVAKPNSTLAPIQPLVPVEENKKESLKQEPIK